MKIIGVILVFLALVSCSKEDPIDSPAACRSLTQIEGWNKISFKSHLTIQTPVNFTGGITVGEGPAFFVENPDNSIVMAYAYGYTIYEEYGPVLTNPDTNSITVKDFDYNDILLDQRLDLCSRLATVGIYFYNLGESRIGTLYWVKDDGYRESLSVFYADSMQQEVENILFSIQEK